jgi:hypothetical protein
MVATLRLTHCLPKEMGFLAMPRPGNHSVTGGQNLSSRFFSSILYVSVDVGAGLKPARLRPAGGHKALPYTSISWTKAKPEETPELSFCPL